MLKITKRNKSYVSFPELFLKLAKINEMFKFETNPVTIKEE